MGRPGPVNKTQNLNVCTLSQNKTLKVIGSRGITKAQDAFPSNLQRLHFQLLGPKLKPQQHIKYPNNFAGKPCDSEVLRYIFFKRKFQGRSYFSPPPINLSLLPSTNTLGLQSQCITDVYTHWILWTVLPILSLFPQITSPSLLLALPSHFLPFASTSRALHAQHIPSDCTTVCSAL